MARIRSIKPEFFSHEELFDLEQETGFPVRLAFAGLWTVADREGRFKWRPRTIKLDVLPYDEVDFAALLDALSGAGFVQRYAVDGEEYGWIPSFSEHQHVNNKEMQSRLPEPPPAGQARQTGSTVAGPEGRAADPNSPGYVYLALAQEAGRVKIGYSKRDPRARLHDLSCGSPEDLILIGCFEGNQADEAEIRTAAKEFHSRREWIEWSAGALQALNGWNARNRRVIHAWPTSAECVVEGEGKGREIEGKGKEGKEEERVTAPARPDADPDIDMAFRAFNDLASEVGLAKAQLLTPTRRKALTARLAECGGIDGWRTAIENIRGSPFLLGDNGRGWKADFDFVLQAKSFTKIMEGSYGAGGSSGGGSSGDAIRRGLASAFVVGGVEGRPIGAGVA